MNRSHVISYIEKTVDFEHNFVEQLRLLDRLCEEVQQYYHEYDFSAEKLGNGFRSIVHITDIYFMNLHSQQENGNFLLNPNLLQDYILLADTLQRSLSYAQLLRKKGVDFEINRQSEIDIQLSELLFHAPDDSTVPIAGSIGPFYYKRSAGTLIHWGVYLVHLLALPVRESFRMLFDSKYSARRMAQSAARTPLYLVKALTPGPIVSRILRPIVRTACLWQGANVAEIVIPRQTNPWEIQIPDWKEPATIARTADREGSFGSLLISPFGSRNDTKSIIIHGHGGGFFTLTPDSAAIPSAALSREFGIPVIIPEYRKIPEHKYPAAVQDVLDLYIFLTSGGADVEKLIGFQPRHVFMSGDSAGANLVTAATFALNRIRTLDHKIMMPKGIRLLCPAVIPTFVAVPSYCFLLLELMLSRGLLGLAAGLYADIGTKIVDDSFMSKSYEENLELGRKFEHKLKDPLLNLLAFRDWGDLKDIPLVITTCEMDPLLDQAIMLAKAWKGVVDFEIVEGMPHGFMICVGDPSIRQEITRYQRQIVNAVSEG